MKNLLLLLLAIPIYSQSIPDKQIPAIYRTIIEKRDCDTVVTQLIADKKEIYAIQLKTVASYDSKLDSITNIIKEKDKNWQLRLDNAVKIEAAKNDRPTPIWRHPITLTLFGILSGVVGGIYISK